MRRDGGTVIAWEGNRPIYADRALLEWRDKAARLRGKVEAASFGTPEYEEAKREYFAHLAK